MFLFEFQFGTFIFSIISLLNIIHELEFNHASNINIIFSYIDLDKDYYRYAYIYM